LQWEWTDAQTLLRLPFSDTQAIVAPRSDRPSCCRGPAINAVALHLLGLALPVPDHTTLSRHAATLEVPRPGHADAGTGSEPMHLLVDSTGLKLCGKGEWLLEKHGSGRGRSQPSPFSGPG